MAEFDRVTKVPLGRFKLMEFSLMGYKKVDQDEEGRPIPADDAEPQVLDTWLLSPGMKLEVSVAPDAITVVVERP